mmetsp:Transcript_2477/g.3246  ORF Transcript_2477/g.3246 Transcript_2477/m.3246 type:complete len:361 (+) Transcript_2477:95-1177(+)
MGTLDGRAYACATALYGIIFLITSYAMSANAIVRVCSILLLLCLPPILASEITKTETEAKDLINSWSKEFVGTAVMIVATCSPGPALGHLGRAFEWTTHWAMMALADYSTGGPQVNPAVTIGLMTHGGFGISPKLAFTNFCAQTAGGAIGWLILACSGPYIFPNPVGGPGPIESQLPASFLMICEGLACWTLMAAVFCFATTSPFSNPSPKIYAAKMTLINITVRMLIVMHGHTGPALNPALATSYVLIDTGFMPDAAHFFAYWIGGIIGAALFAIVWKRLNSDDKTEKNKKSSFAIVSNIAIGIYLGLFATCLWYAKFRPEIDDFIAQRAAANLPVKRNLAQKTGHFLNKIFRPQKVKV